MARATIELHDRAEDACSALESLRAVGLGDANVASVTMDAGPLSQSASGAHRSCEPGPRSAQASIPGLGPIMITGWLVDELAQATGLNPEDWLGQLLQRACPSDKDITLVINALQTGGALVSVCSGDRIGSMPTVDEILKGRGA